MLSVSRYNCSAMSNFKMCSICISMCRQSTQIRQCLAHKIHAGSFQRTGIELAAKSASKVNEMEVLLSIDCRRDLGLWGIFKHEMLRLGSHICLHLIFFFSFCPATTIFVFGYKQGKTTPLSSVKLFADFNEI